MPLPSLTFHIEQCGLLAVLIILLGLPAPDLVLAQTAGECPEGASVVGLQENDVRVDLSNGSILTSGYVSYSASNEYRGAFSLWLGGLAEGELRVTASTLEHAELWPGNHGGAFDTPLDCAARDRMYTISRADIDRYETGQLASVDLRSWPAHLGAPVLDGDGNPSNYDLEAGDRPDLIGDRAVWWVMNDVSGPHSLTGGPPTDIEIQITVYAGASTDSALNSTFLIRVRLINRGKAPIDDAYLGLQRYRAGSYFGSDSVRALAYSYRGDLRRGKFSDENVPGAFGLTLLDSPVGSRLSAVNVFKFNPSVPTPMSQQIYDLLRGLSIEGASQPLYAFSGTPGDPESILDYEGNLRNHRQNLDRILGSVGPFTLTPGESNETVFAVVFGRGEDHLDSVSRLKMNVDRVRAAWEANWVAQSIDPPALAPTLITPGDAVSGQPRDARFMWRPGDAVQHRLQVSLSPTFGSLLIDTLATHYVSLRQFLPAQETLYWRVRATNDGGVGPWSETRSFSTTASGRTGRGPLLLSTGGFAFVQVNAPDGLDPCGPEAVSTVGCAEAGGNAVVRSLDATGHWFMSPLDAGPEANIGDYWPSAFEIRFTEQGSIANYPFNSGRGTRVPFEVWDIGPVRPFDPNDPTDDVQMIASLFADNESGLPDAESECIFGYGSVINDPLGLEFLGTQRIYAYYPTDTYEAHEAIAQPEIDASGGCAQLSNAAFAAIDFGRGRPLQRVVFFGDPSVPDYRAEGPYPGHTVRFYSAPLPSPPLAAPADGSLLSTDPLDLHWYGGNRLQVASTPGFEAPLVDAVDPAPPYRISGLDEGTYYWRVGEEGVNETVWSEVWAFSTVFGVDTEAETTIPTTLTIRAGYPNPFASTTTLPYGLPKATDVSASVFDLLGRRVATLAQNERRPAGWHELRIDGEDWPSGVYFIELTAGDQRATQRLVVVR